MNRLRCKLGFSYYSQFLILAGKTHQLTMEPIHYKSVMFYSTGPRLFWQIYRNTDKRNVLRLGGIEFQ